MAEENKYLDPSAFGFFLVAAISLPLAMAQLSGAIDGLHGVGNIGGLFAIAGLGIIITGLLAWKCNAAFGFVVFALVGISVVLSSGQYLLGIECTMDAYGNLVFGLIYVFAIVWSVIIGAGKNLTALLVTTALIFLELGIKGIMGSTDDYWFYIIGITALGNFALNFYMAMSCAAPEKVPAF